MVWLSKVMVLVSLAVGCRSGERIERGPGLATVSLDNLPPPVACQSGDAARFGGQGFSSLQDALDAAVGGGTLTVCSGTHLVHDLLYDGAGPLRLVGETRDPNDVVLDGQHLGLMLRPSNGAVSLRIEALTFVRGGCSTCPQAGAIDGVPDPNRIDIINSRFDECTSESAYGAVSFQGISHDITNAWFVGNEAGGVDINTWPFADQKVTIRDTTFDSNTNWSGAGLSAMMGGLGTNSILRITDTVFDGNHSFGGEGSADINTFSARVTVLLDRVDFIDNTSVVGAAALRVASQTGDARVGIRDSIFDGNEGEQVGAMRLTGSSLAGSADPWNAAYVSTSRFIRNVSQRTGWNSYGAVQGDHKWKVMWDDVDFSTGADDNVPADFSNCPTMYGAGTSGVTNADQGDHCP